MPAVVMPQPGQSVTEGTIVRWLKAVGDEVAEDEILVNTLPGSPRLKVPKLFRPEFMQQVEKEHPEYFADLPKLA